MKKLIILSLFLFAACNTNTSEPVQTTVSDDGVVINNVALQTDYDGAKIDKKDVISGCRGIDCIPSIDNPIFESVDEASSWLDDEDRVFAIKYKGEKRSYAQRILNSHEIVNDKIAGDYISITFCPLCGSALAFYPIVDGTTTQLGVSGKLHNSDLIMYDRLEGNLWQQVSGEALVGPAARRDEYLEQVAIVTTTWGEWKAEHPDTVNLSRNTGFNNSYTRYPYGTYESDDHLLFTPDNLDETIQIKTPIYGIELGDQAFAYTQEALDREGTITDGDIHLEQLASGEIKATNLSTGEDIIPTRLFWFAWAAFHPDTQLYQ